MLTGTGLFAFVLNTRNFFGLPDVHYGGLPWGMVLAGSLQMLWMLAAVGLLPLQRAAGSRAGAGPVVSAPHALPTTVES